MTGKTKEKSMFGIRGLGVIIMLLLVEIGLQTNILRLFLRLLTKNLVIHLPTQVGPLAMIGLSRMIEGLQNQHQGTVRIPRLTLTGGVEIIRETVASDSSRDLFLTQVGRLASLRERPELLRTRLPGLKRHASGSLRRLGNRMRIGLHLLETSGINSTIITTPTVLITRTRVEREGRSNGTTKRTISVIGGGMIAISTSESNFLFFCLLVHRLSVGQRGIILKHLMPIESL
jgi:hypothetical protein